MATPDRIDWKPPLIILGTIVLAVGAYLMLPGDMNELAKRAVAIFIIAAVFGATDVIPLYATSLCLIGLQVLLLAHHGGLAPADAGPVGGLISAIAVASCSSATRSSCPGCWICEVRKATHPP